jgi:hypothetical protein
MVNTGEDNTDKADPSEAGLSEAGGAQVNDLEVVGFEEEIRVLLGLPADVVAALNALDEDLASENSTVIIVVTSENEAILNRARRRLRVEREVATMPPVKF